MKKTLLYQAKSTVTVDQAVTIGGAEEAVKAAGKLDNRKVVKYKMTHGMDNVSDTGED